MGLRVPVVNAPMGGAAGGRLAAAVTRAGGLGMVGMGSAATAPRLSTELVALGTDIRPYGIGLVHWVMAATPDLLDIALAARPTVLSVSFSTEYSWVARVHAAGVQAVTQVADIDDARRAVDAGIDIVVARGAEGGGHGRPAIGTLALLAEVLDAVEVPVLAAGGIGTARALAAVLACGAAGAWVGTAFAACSEALTGPRDRAALIAARSDATTLTREFDIAAGYPWPAELPERVLCDADGVATPVNAGQGGGAVTGERSAAEVIDDLADGAYQLLHGWG